MTDAYHELARDSLASLLGVRFRKVLGDLGPGPWDG
jgi:hypothetical protein